MAWKKGLRERKELIDYHDLAQVVEKAEELISQHPEDLKSFTDFEFTTERDYDDCSILYLEYYTKATEAELKAEADSKKRREAWQREQYEQLKKKFEGQA